MIITPLLSGQTLHPEVIRGVASQTLQMPWLVHTARNMFTGLAREVNINANRHSIKQLAKDIPCDHIVLLDSDVVMDNPRTLQIMVETLRCSDAQCLAVRTKKGDTDHVITALAIMGYHNYLMVNHMLHPHECQCLAIAGMCKTAYIENLQAREI